MSSLHAQNLWDVLPTPLAGAWRELAFADAMAAGHLASVFLERMLQFAAVIEFGRLRLHVSQTGSSSDMEKLRSQLDRSDQGRMLTAGGWYHLLLRVWKAQDGEGMTTLARPSGELLQTLVNRRNDAVHRNDVDISLLEDVGHALGQFGVFTSGRLVWFSGQTQFQGGETCSQVRICVGTDSKGQPEELRWQAASNIEPGIYWMSVALSAEQMLVPLHGLVECRSLPLTTDTWSVATTIFLPAHMRSSRATQVPWEQLGVSHGELELAKHRMTPTGKPRPLLQPTTPVIPSWNVAASSGLHLSWNPERAGPHRASGTHRVLIGTTGAPAAADAHADWMDEYDEVSVPVPPRRARFALFAVVAGLLAAFVGLGVNRVGGAEVALDAIVRELAALAPPPPTTEARVQPPAPAGSVPVLIESPPAPADSVPVPATVAAQPASTAVAVLPDAAVAIPTPSDAQALVPSQATASRGVRRVSSFSTSVCTQTETGAFRYSGTGSAYRLYWAQPGDLTPSALWRQYRTYDERWERNPTVLRSSGDFMLIRAHFCTADGCAEDDHSAIVYFAVRRSRDRKLDGFYYSNFDRSEGPLRGAVGTTDDDCSTLAAMDPSLRCMLDRMVARRTATTDAEGQAFLESAFDRCTR